jgi:type VI secretion system protein ImpH
MSGQDANRVRVQRVFGEVEAAPYRHDFYAVMRLLETLNRLRPRWGKALRPRDEVLRLGQDPELDFAPAAISTFQQRGGGVPRLGQRFFGLFGPMGPLPLHLTEYARERARNHADMALARFVDQFHHRAGLLFYRAWAMSQPTVHLDRRADDAFSRWIGSLAGIGDATLTGRDSLADDAKRHRVAILARGAKTAEGLTKLLRGYFGIAVRLESHVGHWLAMRPEDRTRLLPITQPGLRNALGISAVAGAKVWDRQFRFRLHLGPMDYASYQRFLPGQRSIVELRDWVRQYVGLGLSFDVVSWLRGGEVPRLALGVRREQDGRLGWTTWLGGRRAPADRGDLRVNPETSNCNVVNGIHHG